ncbi:MAG: hypothetical protein KGL12_14460 [Rhodospirillales bacterium]|nr:hypothetical protein [Rhodospirillales bacterium]
MMISAPPRILLLNPNSSRASTAMMVTIAQRAARCGDGRMAACVRGHTARHAPAMIVDGPALNAAGREIAATARLLPPGIAGIVVAAFGDPGLGDLRARLRIPATGLAEASMREAALGGRRFGVATVTPGLVDAIAARAAALGLGGQFTGTRLTAQPAAALMGRPEALRTALAEAIEACRRDGAEVAIIGGGPLAAAARQLARHSTLPLIAPVPASVRAILTALGHRESA